MTSFLDPKVKEVMRRIPFFVKKRFPRIGLRRTAASPRVFNTLAMKRTYKVSYVYFSRPFGRALRGSLTDQGQHALEVINGRQRKRRPEADLSASGWLGNGSQADKKTKLRGSPSIFGMRQWLMQLGHSPQDINALNIVHVAGTKGKGSTCAFTESFLRAHGQRTGFPTKTGLYTSPHLILPEERIRIDSVPLPRDLFAKYLFEVYDKLPQLRIDYGPSSDIVDRGPRLLQLYALLALHVFVRERVDAAIIETHNGGEYDATNVIEKPLVTAITTLGMDHVEMLGPLLEDIAWHKSGIFKPGATALSAAQDPVPATVLDRRAEEKGTTVSFVDEDSRLPRHALQLKPSVQRKNASLAIAAAEAFLQRSEGNPLQQLSGEDIKAAIRQWSWPGRFQIIPVANTTWFLDAAHNEMSARIASQWFAESSTELDRDASRVLIFSHISELRDTLALLQSLARALKATHVGIAHVIFTTYEESDEGNKSVDEPVYTDLRRIWNNIFPETEISDRRTIKGAMKLVEDISGENSRTKTQVFVTGSQHLVGPVLRILQSKPSDEAYYT